MNRSLRILFVVHTPADAATSVFNAVTQRATYLRSIGHAVDLVAPSDVGMGNMSRLLPLLYPIRIAALCRRARYDVVVFHSYSGWAFHVLRRWMDPRRATTSVISFHGLEPLYHRAVRKEFARVGKRMSLRFQLLHLMLLPRLLRMSARRADAVLCLSSEERAFLVDSRWCDPARVFVHWNGVEPEFLLEHRHVGRGSRLLFIGQWLLPKGIRYLTHAFAELAETRPDITLVCAGTGAPASQVLADFPETVRFRVSVYPRLGRSDLLAQLAGADVFMFPSLSEGSSAAVLEAMAAGVPMVATRAGASQDLLEDGVNAVLVPFADAAALAAGAGLLLDDPLLRQRLADRARSTVSTYQWPAINAIYAERLLMIVEAGRSGPRTQAEEDAVAR